MEIRRSYDRVFSTIYRIFYPGKMSSLYWIRAQVSASHLIGQARSYWVRLLQDFLFCLGVCHIDSMFDETLGHLIFIPTANFLPGFPTPPLVLDCTVDDEGHLVRPLCVDVNYQWHGRHRNLWDVVPRYRLETVASVSELGHVLTRVKWAAIVNNTVMCNKVRGQYYPNWGWYTVCLL